MDVWELLPWNIQCCILSLLPIKKLIKLKRVSKSWQSIITSATFGNLQLINTNLYENDIIMKPLDNSFQFIMKSLESTELQYFDLKQLDLICCFQIFGVNSGFILFEVVNKAYPPNQFVLCNPATKQLIKLPQLDCSEYLSLTCDLLVDLQYNTYKLFLLGNHIKDFLTLHMYNSMTNMWQTLDSFSKFQSNFRFGYFESHILIYKKKLYVFLKARPNELMVVVYDPINDTWKKLDMIFSTNKMRFGRFVIANDRLFFVQIIYKDEHRSFSIIEVKTEGSTSFPMASIEKPLHLQCCRCLTRNYIYGIDNKIIISEYIQNFDVIYDVCTHEETEKFVNSNLQSKSIKSYHSLNYNLISLQSNSTSCTD
jgi:hypothetical protein